MGYDADSQTYTFVDTSTGRYYESEEGNRYGALHPVGSRSSRSNSVNSTTTPEALSPSAGGSPDKLWAQVEEHNEAIRKQNREAVRLMLPFALLVLVSLLLLFRFIGGGGGSGSDSEHGADVGAGVQVRCHKGYHAYEVQEGETCWAIGKASGLGVEELLSLDGNEEVDCGALAIGQRICVPS